MKVFSSKRVLGITVLLLLMVTEGYTKPQRPAEGPQTPPRQRSGPPRQWGPPGQKETSEQTKQQRVFGELPPLGQEVKRCSEEPPRRLVGSRLDQRNMMEARCEFEISTLLGVRPSTPCFPVPNWKVKLAQGPESQCAVFAE
ncbi:hypothetical protein Pmani_002978 [Petrolisthes manimaculis]|uniref:Uncharacterized protein n=1 Tax=Petrolisthes manimaculis TaxID=1843537 RepID=A0AAE1QHI3_9EUCA|nr:hypothetical protein Pmani_002978 [Petrolisthes manimaculis]